MKLHLRHELDDRGPIFCKAAEQRASHRTSDVRAFLDAMHRGTGCLNCLDKALTSILYYFKSVNAARAAGRQHDGSLLATLAPLFPPPCCLHEPHHGGCTEHAGPCPSIDPRNIVEPAPALAMIDAQIHKGAAVMCGCRHPWHGYRMCKVEGCFCHGPA